MRWAVAYIDNKYRDGICEALAKEIENYKVSIPCIKVLKKKFKNKKHFQTLPLLFNYGFIWLPEEYLKSRESLIDIKNRVAGIYSWMYREPSKEGFIVETVSYKEIKVLNKRAENLSIFSIDELNRFKEGDQVILKGYPFDGLAAKIKHINQKHKKITVYIYIMSSMREVEVSYENIFYSIYDNFDDSVNSGNIEEIEHKFKNSRDRIEFKNSNYDRD